MQEQTAVVCANPGQLLREQRPWPTRGEGEALIGIRRIGICGTDYHIFGGQHPFLAYPRIMGHELAGEVLEAPADSGLAPGDAVIVNPYLSCGTCIACRNGKPNCCTRIQVLGVHRDGGMTEALSLPVGNLIPGGGLSLDACATVEFLAIGAHAVARAAIGSGARALVVGAGPIGLGVALFAVLSGGRVTLMDRDRERLDAAGAITGIGEHIVADDAAPAAIAKATLGEGFDVVFDATGNSAAMEAGFLHVAHGGTYVLVSVVKDRIGFSDAEFHKREMTLLGSRNATGADFRRVIAAIEAGQVPVERLITHRTTLAGVLEDLPRWARAKSGLVKAMVEVG